MSETACKVCGKEGHRNGECTVEAGSPSVLTPERLAALSSLETEIHADFDPVLKAVNDRLGLKMEKRPDGFHMTIVGPTEYSVIKTLPPEKIAELEALNDELQRGEGITVAGIGFLDGAVMNVREVDKVKRAAFVALDAPKLQAFRASVGLPPKYLHVTLGFEGADLHMQITGTNEKGKPVLGPVEKVADPQFADLLPMVEAAGMKFGSLSGSEKQAKQEKPVATPEAKKSVAYDIEALTELLATVPALNREEHKGMREEIIEAAKGGSDALGPLVGKLGGKLRGEMGSVRDAIKKSEKI